MAAMTLQQLRDYVRLVVDADEEDLPNELLDVMIEDSFSEIAYGERRWAFYEFATTLTVTDATQTYPLTAIGGNDTLQIFSVQDGMQALNPIPHQTAVRRFLTDLGTTGRPNYWSVWSGNLYIWPIPDASYDLEVQGYRRPTDWQSDGAGALPDLPVEFHPLLARRTIAAAFSQQDDPELGSLWQTQFDDGIRRLRRRYAGMSSSGPMVLNGSVRREEPFAGGGLFFDWE